MSSPQSSYSNDQGSWFAGDGQPYPDPGWDSRRDKNGAPPSVHYPRQVSFEEPAHAGQGAAEPSDPPYASAGNEPTPAETANREWPRGDPELAAVVRRDSGGATEPAGGYGADAPPFGADPGAQPGGTQHRDAGEPVPPGPSGPPFVAASPVDPPTSQVPAFHPVDGSSPPPHAAPAATMAPETPGYPAAAGVPPVLASMLQQSPTGGHPTQPVQPRSPNQLADGAYRTNRPGSAVALVLGALLFAMPPLVLVWRSALDTGSSSGVIGGTLALLGLPLLAAGLYPLMGGGAATGAREYTALLRPPYIYLLLGVALLTAAGLAAA